MSNSLKLALCILLTVAIGAVSGLFTAGNVTEWYTTINRPAWNPPNWIFGPVWTALYILMGICFYLIITKPARQSVRKTAFVLFLFQLVLNFFWSLIFFSMHEIGWALVEIGVLWMAILLTIFAVARISKPAAWLLVPYISWVSFASILNFTIWQLNR